MVLFAIFQREIQTSQFTQNTSFVSITIGQLRRKNPTCGFILHLIYLIFTPKDAKHFTPSCVIFFNFFGPFFKKLFHFLSANFSKIPFYTKRFKNDNGNLVLKRQKKIGFLQLIPNFPKDMPDFKKSQDVPLDSASFNV